MDCVFAITGNDYVLLASDKTICHSIIKMQEDDQKILNLGNNKMLASVAEVNTRKNFTKLIKANLQYNYYRYGNDLLTSEIANFTRNLQWESLRSRNPYQISSLICGVDNGVPSLYVIEQLGGMERVTRGAIGYCAYFLLGMMDNCYCSDFTLDKGKDCIRKCISDLKTRFLVNSQKYDVLLIKSDGVTDLSSEFN